MEAGRIINSFKNYLKILTKLISLQKQSVLKL